MTRRSRREIEQALDDLAGGRSTGGGRDGGALPEKHREAVRSALAWRYDNYDAADADPADARALLAEAVEHVDDPHAAAIRDLLGRGGST